MCHLPYYHYHVFYDINNITIAMDIAILPSTDITILVVLPLPWILHETAFYNDLVYYHLTISYHDHVYYQ